MKTDKNDNTANGAKSAKVFVKAFIIIFVCAMLIAGGWFLYKKRFGDPTAPMNLVPAEWHAWLTFTDNEPRVRFEIKADVLKVSPDKPIYIPLFPSTTVFRDVAIDGKPLIPVKRDNWYCAEIRSAGSYAISASVDAKPVKDGAESKFSVIKPAFVRSTVHVDAADAIDFRVKGAEGRISGTKQTGTHGAIDVGPAQELSLSWREPRADAIQTGTPSVKPSIVWKIGEKVLSANAVLDVQIVGGKCDHFVVELPQGSDKVRVDGAYARDSRLSGNKLTVYFRQYLSGSVNVRLSFDTPRPAGDTVTLPQISVEGGRVEEGGWLVVVNDSNGVVLENSVAGLTAVADFELPPQLRGLISGKPLYLYNVSARNAAPVFDVMTKRPFPLIETIADRADIMTVVQPGGEEITRIIYQIRNNSRQFINLKLPADSRLISVKVDGKDCKVSGRTEDSLIPLAKSIQTLGGLIPFPMEVVYCRQGRQLKGQVSRVVDYPEISEIPVAVVNAMVYLPDDLTVKSYRSSLERVEQFRSSGMSWMMQMPGAGATNKTTDISGWINDALAYNYYNVGYSAYQQNKLEDAEIYLGKTKDIAASNKPLTSQSDSIMLNIKAGRGDFDAKGGKEQRAKVQAIQGALSIQNEELESQQSQLVDAGLANIKEGDERLGMELLMQAEEVGAQIANRSGSALRQQALRRNYDTELKAAAEEKKRNDELKTSLQRLEREAQEVAKTAEKDKEVGKKFASGWLTGAREQKMEMADVAMVSEPAVSYSQPADISVQAEAAQMKGRISGSGGAAAKSKMTRSRGTNASMKDENKRLEAKASALKKALDYAKSDAPAPTQAAAPVVDVSGIKQSIARQSERVSKIADGYNVNNAWADDATVEKELDQVANWTLSGKNSFGNLNDSLRAEYDKVDEEIRLAKDKIGKVRQERSKSQQVALDMGDVVDRDNTEKQKALGKFIGKNYLSDDQLKTVGGQLIVANDSGKAEEVGTVLRKLQDNRGNAVTVGGRNVDINYKEIPVVNGWFTNQLSEGKKYAVIDEAQYRTLIQAAHELKPGSAAVSGPEKRDVVVGTDNGVAGEKLSLVNADADSNGIRIGGKDIKLGHDKYLAVGDADGISVIKAGQMHDWQEQGKDLGLDVEAPYRVDMPQTGRKICFEKTLLSAGESADIELKFEI